MDMVPVYEDEATDSSAISVDPVTVQNMGIRVYHDEHITGFSEREQEMTNLPQMPESGLRAVL